MINELDIQRIARVCHEANAAWCRGHNDHTQPSWETAPDWQRSSVIDGVLFHLMHPEAGPEASHENWLQLKLVQGWKYGPKKDELKKEHPCCVPFVELPPVQQAKDKLFRSIVHALAPQRVTEEMAQTAADIESAHK